MVFDITTFCANDYLYLDDVSDATFEPVDAAGGLGVTHEVKVASQPISKPQAVGGRLALPQTHTGFEFWKGDSPAAPDPKPNDFLTVGAIKYTLDGVEDTRRSKFTVAAVQTNANTPAV